MTTQPTSLSYKDAGVDIDAGEALVQRIKSVAKATSRSEVVGGLGGFGALCRIPQGYKSPLLVSGTDGVGTKQTGFTTAAARYHWSRLGSDVCQ